MSYEEILNRTLPQINSIRARLGYHIELKVGMKLFEGTTEPAKSDGKAPKLSELEAFCKMF